MAGPQAIPQNTRMAVRSDGAVTKAIIVPVRRDDNFTSDSRWMEFDDGTVVFFNQSLTGGREVEFHS